MNIIHRHRVVVVARNLAREMKDRGDVLARLGDIVAIRNRALDRLDARVLHPFGHTRRHYFQIFLARVQKLPDDMRTQEIRSRR